MHEEAGQTEQPMSEAEAAALNDLGVETNAEISPSLAERIRERPLLSLGLAGLSGFVLGGGAFSRTGAAALMLVGRIWLKRTAADLLANAMSSYGTTRRSSPGSRRT